MSKKTLVTSALIYANGPAHLGHMVEYLQTDIYVKALKQLGEDVIYVCADDTHGTPIEINAAKAGMTPQEYIASWHQKHKEDFDTYGVDFDSFSTTNSEENHFVTNEIYKALSAKNVFQTKEVDGFYCEHDKRFLPDRYVRGICPKCGAEDQYGDVCEKCLSTYEPTELKEPKCAICHNTPVIKSSKHLFLSLSESADFLQEYIKGALGEELKNHVQKWIDEGLKSWCISRDAPYFGFEIPDIPGKYFYVWFDAPIGYIGSTVTYCKEHGLDPFKEYWQNDEARIVHVIGKDIVYFHSLFWPTVLKNAGYHLPDTIQVHGMLTVDGKKMSKSRGTFIPARDFAAVVDPEYLRYYYATKLSEGAEDIDLAFGEFQNRINAELVNKIANLVHRSATLIERNFGGKLAALNKDEFKDIIAQVEAKLAEIKELYPKFRFSEVTKNICEIADIGNGLMQDRKPWELVKSDPDKAQQILTMVAHICQTFAIALKPITPKFVARVEEILGQKEPLTFNTPLWSMSEPMRAPKHLAQRFDKQVLEDLVTRMAKQMEEQTKAAEEAPKKPFEPIEAEIPADTFFKVDLRVGKILTAENIKKSKKLLKLSVDLGEPEPRQILSGIALTFKPEDLIGRKVIVVANLAPRQMMGLDSYGMIIATGEPTAIKLATVDGEPGDRIS